MRTLQRRFGLHLQRGSGIHRRRGFGDAAVRSVRKKKDQKDLRDQRDIKVGGTTIEHLIMTISGSGHVAGPCLFMGKNSLENRPKGLKGPTGHKCEESQQLSLFCPSRPFRPSSPSRPFFLPPFPSHYPYRAESSRLVEVGCSGIVPPGEQAVAVFSEAGAALQFDPAVVNEGFEERVGEFHA